ncbi:hypothetical protein [Actinacidiphila guanduensis]|uniref:Uncharacterized protein n=1 Tax=Actinacidiphila guanduensis TaxID=310781 RepID=A0A1H0LQ03_9ACTN|nr:hypothetical protein [Actinacidiphila guanduensis]SDO70076.1 hypothetical protein SAMN05216259_111287 [Actinacidiphila guanduensis]
MHRMRSAVAATATLAAVLGAAGTAAADTATATPAPATATASPKGDPALRLCKRVPGIDRRIDRALNRLHGPASERGSIARLQKRVDAAKKRGDSAVATYLGDKLAFRTSLVTTLQQRSTDLDAVRDWCGTQGAAAKTAAAS